MNKGSERLVLLTWESEAGAGLEAGPPPVVAAGSGRALAKGSPWGGVGASAKEHPGKAVASACHRLPLFVSAKNRPCSPA